MPRPHRGFPSVASAVRDYFTTHPADTDRQAAADAIGCLRDDVSYYLRDQRNSEARKRRIDGRADPRARPVKLTAEQLARMLPMAPGEGDRRDDCAHYVDHVANAARASPGAAHCPDGCPKWRERDRKADLVRGATTWRETMGSERYHAD